MNKYTYYKVIQQFIADKWEDVDQRECDSTAWIKGTENRKEFRSLVADYRANTPYSTRVVKRREINQPNTESHR